MNFSAMFQTWVNILTKPGEAVFQEAQDSPQATFQSAVIWIVIATVISAVLGVISSTTNSLIFGQMGDSIERALIGLDPLVAEQIRASFSLSLGSLAISFCASLIITPIAFLIGSLIYFAIAKLLGGLGDFERHTFLLAAISAPISVVMGIINIVPLLGICIGLLLWVYQIVLTYFAMKVTHNLTSGKAVLVAVSPFLIFLLLLCCIGALVGVLVGATTSGQL